MAITWGTTTLNVMKIQRGAPELLLSEVDLIPDPDAAGDEPQSVLMGWGTRRRRIYLDIHCTDTEFQSFGTDTHNFQERALDLSDIESSLSWDSAIIESLKCVGRVKGKSNFLYAQITFLEVDSGV